MAPLGLASITSTSVIGAFASIRPGSWRWQRVGSLGEGFEVGQNGLLSSRYLPFDVRRVNRSWCPATINRLHGFSLAKRLGNGCECASRGTSNCQCLDFNLDHA
ncbi:hypothetical protein F5X96DRAFT_155324 [Biscogniauxia mediterranea]|nr:hypothetical protein F5X96DRAFT_155324 [Biscogniauxia mediterranea]